MSARGASFALLGLFALGACKEAEPVERPIVGSLPAGHAPLDALTRGHARLRERLAARGYVEVPPTARVFTAEDRGVLLPLDLAVGRCTTLTGLATSGIRDLRLRLYDEDGVEVATDDVPGEGGLVHVCPEPHPHRSTSPFYLAVEVRDGLGSVALGEFRSKPGEGDGFEGLWDDLLAPRVPFPDVEARLAEARTALRARGLTPVAPPRVAWVGDGAALRVPLTLEREHCYVAIARGGAGTRDVDLFLFDPAGVEIARDIGTDAEPTVEHCTETGGVFMVEARAFDSQGAIGVMVMGGAAPSIVRDESAELASVLETERGQRAESGAADLTLGVLAAELAERGFDAPVYASRDASIAPGETRTHELVIGPGCSLVIASASNDGMDVDLYLADETGRELDADTAMHATARVRACLPTPTVVRVAVKAYGRDGRYALAAMRAPTAIGDVQGLRLEEAIAGPRVRGFEIVERFAAELEAGVPLRRELVVAPGRCTAIAAAGAAEVRDVDLFLRDADGALVASEAGQAALATVSRCATDAPEMLVLEAVSAEAGQVAFALLDAAVGS